MMLVIGDFLHLSTQSTNGLYGIGEILIAHQSQVAVCDLVSHLESGIEFDYV